MRLALRRLAPVSSDVRGQVLRRTLLAIVSAAICCLATLPAAAEARVAVVDLRRAMLDTEDGLRVTAELQQLQDSRQSQLEAKRDQYLKLKTQYEKLAQAPKPNMAEVRKIAKAHDQALYDLQTAEQGFRRELQRSEWQKTKPLREKVLGLIRRVASQSGYDLVVLKEVAPFYRKDLDITDRIIQLYNQSLGPEPPKPAPPSPSKPAPPPSKGPAKQK